MESLQLSTWHELQWLPVSMSACAGQHMSYLPVDSSGSSFQPLTLLLPFSTDLLKTLETPHMCLDNSGSAILALYWTAFFPGLENQNGFKWAKA